MALLPYADAQTASSSVRQTLDRHPVAVLRMLAHADTVFEPWRDYTGALLGNLELDPVLREFAILQIARIRGSDYQWVQHAALARAVGAGAEQIAAIKEGREEDPALSEADRDVLRFARQATLDGAAGEDSVSSLAARLGPRQVVELLLVVGHWNALCGFVATFGLEPDLPAMAGALPDTLALRDAPAS